MEKVKKYVIDTEENRVFLGEQAQNLLDFGKNFLAKGKGSYYLGDDGAPWADRPVETWITCRMIHVYSMAAMKGYEGANELAKGALDGLMNYLRDKKNGGFYSGISADNEVLENKQCYAHAFVILAGTSAKLAGIDGADELLKYALECYDKFFWDESEGLSVDTWNTEFSVLDDYRGLNANMHTVEAFLAVADVCQDESYRRRAGRIIDRVIGWAADNDWRIPEHFLSDWSVDLEKNKEKPDDPFKPYGATPGHGIEWARLITQWTKSTHFDSVEMIKYIDAAEKLYNRAVSDAWNSDGALGIVYTTDWNGKPVVRDRMHWTLAEAINSSSVLYGVTGKDKYAEDYYQFMEYLDEKVIDHKNKSWFHQLDENNVLKGTVWPGKSDLYHAFQAMLIPYAPAEISIAKAVKENRA